MTLDELRDFCVMIKERQPDALELSVVRWDDRERVPVERQGSVILACFLEDGEMFEMIEPADLASNMVDDGSEVDFQTGEWRAETGVHSPGWGEVSL